MICYNCGKKNKENATFCANCGEKLGKFKPEDFPDDTGVDSWDSEWSDDTTRTKGASGQKNRKLIIILSVVIAVALVAAATIFALMHFGVIGGDSGNAPVSTAPTVSPMDQVYRDADDDIFQLHADGKYEEAVQHMLDLTVMYPDDITLQNLLVSCQDILRSSILDQAQEYEEQWQYLDAAHTIMDVQDTYDCPEFQERMDEYRIYLTRPLSFCTSISDSNADGSTSDIDISGWTDCLGTYHPNSLKFWVCNRRGWSNTEHIAYDLECRYQTLSGSIVAAEDSDPDAVFQIRIYVDGALMYQSEDIVWAGEPVSFSIPVAAANQVRIECTTDSDAFGYCIVDVSVSEI